MMIMRLLQSYFLLCLAFSATSFVSAQQEDDDAGVFGRLKQSLFDPLKTKYDDLSPKGRFATGAVVGFTTSKFAINTAVGALKFAGAAFIASEALNYAGALDYVPEMSDDSKQFLNSAKQSVKKNVNKYRKQIRQCINPKEIQASVDRAIQNDKAGVFGVAAGAFIGFAI